MISSRTLALGAVLSAVLLWGAAVSCVSPSGQAQAGPANTFEEIISRGVLRVGLNAGYLPFEMKRKDGGFVGFDVEIAEEMAKRLGVKLEIVNTAWDGIIPALDTGKFDVIISGMTRTLDRAKKVHFSDPYFVTGQVLLLNGGNAAGINGYADLNDPKWTVSVVLGTTGHFAAQKYMPKATLRVFEKEAEASMEVLRGKAHAFVFDEPYIRIFTRQNPEKTRPVFEPFTYEPLCFAVRKHDYDLLLWLNLFIEDIKNDAPKGQSTYDRLFDKYFVSMSWLEEKDRLELPE